MLSKAGFYDVAAMVNGLGVMIPALTYFGLTSSVSYYAYASFSSTFLGRLKVDSPWQPFAASSVFELWLQFNLSGSVTVWSADKQPTNLTYDQPRINHASTKHNQASTNKSNSVDNFSNLF